MQPITVKAKRLTPDADLPAQKSALAAGFDLECESFGPDRDIVALVDRGDTVLINTGIALEIPEGFEGQIRLRSSSGLRGWVMCNAPGTIDADYRGEIRINILNLGDPFLFRDGMRVAQLVICPVPAVVLEEVTELGTTERGTGGFGSTGQ